MDLFDSVSSLWSEGVSSVTSAWNSVTGSEDLSSTISPSAYTPGSMLSAHYSIGNLSPTSKALSQPNLPSTETQVTNLGYLADVLEQVQNEIGPFQILSGFRTKELQEVLKSSGEPTAAGTSFHELGRAVDIAPTSMTTAEFFGRLLASDQLKSQFAEIAIKPSQNALHLAVNVPGDVREPKVLGLNDAGNYARLGVGEIAKYIEPFMQSAEDAYAYAEEKMSSSKMPLIIAGVAVVGIAFMMMTKQRRVL